MLNIYNLTPILFYNVKFKSSSSAADRTYIVSEDFIGTRQNQLTVQRGQRVEVWRFKSKMRYCKRER